MGELSSLIRERDRERERDILRGENKKIGEIDLRGDIMTW